MQSLAYKPPPPRFIREGDGGEIMADKARWFCTRRNIEVSLAYCLAAGARTFLI
jgi:hypothetical protein